MLQNFLFVVYRQIYTLNGSIARIHLFTHTHAHLHTVYVGKQEASKKATPIKDTMIFIKAISRKRKRNFSKRTAMKPMTKEKVRYTYRYFGVPNALGLWKLLYGV